MSEFALPLARPRGSARRGANKAKAPARPARRSGAKLAIAVLAAMAAGLAATAAIAALSSSSFFLISRREVVGAANMSREEVLSAALLHENEYWFSVEPSRTRAGLLADPRIADAKVTKLFPNGIRIEVTERRAVAAVLADLDGRLAAVGVDAEGVAFGPASPADLAKAPVLSGLRFESFRAGARLPDELRPILASLAAIELSEPTLLGAFSEIRVVKPRYGALELLLYPLNSHIPVRAASTLGARDLKSIILVLDVLASRGLAATIEELDFRTGAVVYRSKGGQTG